MIPQKIRHFHGRIEFLGLDGKALDNLYRCQFRPKCPKAVSEQRFYAIGGTSD